MDWRNFAFGSLATLTATIIGGIVVFYLTRDDTVAPEAHLVYKVGTPTTFTSENTKLSIHTIEVRNDGATVAEDVKIAIRFPKTMRVIDKRISFSTGLAATYDYRDVPDEGADLTIPSLTAGESLKISYLMDGLSLATPTVHVKSRKIAGEEIFDQLIEPTQEKERRLYETLKFILPILFIFQIGGVGYLVYRRLTGKSMPGIGYEKSRNNTAFLLLHKSMYKEAERILAQDIKETGGGAAELANYALCMALSDNIELTKTYLESAQFLASTGREKAIVAFNRSLAYFHSGNIDKGKENLLSALRLQRREIVKYIGFSDLVRQLREESDPTDAAFGEALSAIRHTKIRPRRHQQQLDS